MRVTAVECRLVELPTTKPHRWAGLTVDVGAQRANLPVYELLGGRRRDRIPMAHSVGLMPVDEAVQRARDVVDEGMRTVKLKVGEDIPRDLELVPKVCDAVGDRTEITLD